jgi:amidase
MTKLSRRAALKSSAAFGLIAGSACSRDVGRPSAIGDLAEMDAIATAQAIKNGAVSAREIVNAAIDRAEAAEAKISAIVTPYYDTARDQAAAASEGAWFGVPTFVKDLNNVIGQRTTYGSRAFEDYVATDQSEFIDAFFANGLISLGKSATPEFGLTATTEPMIDTPTRNPWNLDHSAGGSSGGAAALVAAHVVPVAHASDGGGSIRIPASCCGVVGLKPSRGRTPRPDGPAGRPLEISQHGIETRTVRDTAAFFAMMEVASELPLVGFVDGPAAARKTIAFFTNSPVGGNVDPEIVAAADATAKTLEDLGHEVTEIGSPFDAGVLQDFTLYWGAGAAQAVANWEERAGRKAAYNDFEPWTYGVIDYYESRRHTLDDVVARLQSFEQDYMRVFSNTDLILSPTLAAPPPAIGYLAPSQAFPIVLERITELVCFTQFMNISGAPAMSLPSAMSEKGLPIGVQLAAVQGNERAILEVAYELEEAAPWVGRTPKL